MHYGSFQKAKEAWERRRTRVDLSNTFVQMSDRYANAKDMKKFLALPYNKIYYSAKPIDHKDVFHHTRFADRPITEALWKAPGRGRPRFYWDFDLVTWLNARGTMSVADVVEKMKRDGYRV